MLLIPDEYIMVKDLTLEQQNNLVGIEVFNFNKEVFGIVPERGFIQCILVSDIPI